MRRPRGGDERSSPSRAAPGLRPGTLGSPARSSLTAGREACPRLFDKAAQKGPASKQAGGRVKRSVRKRGPAPNRRRDGAPRGATCRRRHVTKYMARRLARHPLDLSRGAEMEDGVPGAAKNTGGGALANASSFRGASHKRVYARLRRAMASEPGIQRRRHCANFWIPGPAQMRRPGMTGDQLLKCLLSFKLCAW